MRISHLAAQIVVALAIPATCLMALNEVATVSHEAPHRRPSVGAAAKPRPYAPTPATAGIAKGRASHYQPLHVAAQKAGKTWNHTAWVATGGIERHHFWLGRPFDARWHGHLFFLRRERWFWWHHRHLYYLWWLGQGWEYQNGSATRPSVVVSNVAVESTGGGAAVPLHHTRPMDVSLRVQALSVLSSLQLTNEQFSSLQDALGQLDNAGDVVDADVIDNILDTNPQCLDTLDQLYKDYVQVNDDQVLDDQDRLLHQEDKYQVCVEPTVIVSNEARTQAAQIFQLLSAGQVASYLSARGQVVPDPTDILLAGLNQCRQLSAADFADYSNCLAERFAILTTGLDASTNQPVIDEVKGMFARARPERPGIRRPASRLRTGRPPP